MRPPRICSTRVLRPFIIAFFAMTVVSIPAAAAHGDRADTLPRSSSNSAVGDFVTRGGPLVKALREWLSSSTGSGSSPAPMRCDLSGEWTFDVSNFCSYQWEVDGASGALSFNTTCPNDSWAVAHGTPPDATTGAFELTFVMANGGVVARKQATVHPTCDFVDVVDGGFYSRGPPLPMLGRSNQTNWLKTLSAFLLRRAWTTATDGTALLTPGYPVKYNGQWMRDGFYGIFNGRELLQNATLAIRSAEFMFSYQHNDTGVMPVMVTPAGVPRYGTQCNNSQHDCQDLDNGPFAVFLASAAVMISPSPDEGIAFFRRYAKKLVAAMDSVPRQPNGLAYAPPGKRFVGYGFQDSVVKTGEVLYSSVLYHDAALAIADLAERAGGDLVPLVADFRNRSDAIAAVLGTRLWDESVGMFRASYGGLESDQIDVWGSAAAAAAGLTTASQDAAVALFFQNHAVDVLFEGQVREIPWPHHWDQLAYGHDVRDNYYQNGGYWATPHHHVLPVIARHNSTFACAVLADTIASFRSHGINEWIGPFWPNENVGMPGYIASAANTYAAVSLMGVSC